MIPKRIFYVWGYSERKSVLANVCIENWRMMLSDYDIVEVNENTPEWFDFDAEYNTNLWFKTVYDLKMWAYISDYIRIKTIFDHGGIYLDTDVTVYKKFDNLLLHDMFIGNAINNFPEMAVFGANKSNLILKKINNFYKKDIWESPFFIITNIFKKIIQYDFHLNLNIDGIIHSKDIVIYPPEYFHPFHYHMEFSSNCITQNTYTVHWGAGSWHIKKNLFFLSNKHRIPLPALLKKMEFIDKYDPLANQKININEAIKLDAENQKQNLMHMLNS